MGSCNFDCRPVRTGHTCFQYSDVALASQVFPLDIMSQTGTIKKFFEDKGFGFITPDDGSEDVFAHVKQNPALEGCQAGDACTFDTKWDDRKGKYNADNVSMSGGGGGGGNGGGKGKGGGGYSPYGGKGW